MARIDKRLNITFETETADGATAYVYSTPINEMIFDKFCIILAKAYGMIIREGLGIAAGPRVASRIVKKIAMDEGTWDGTDGVNLGLLQELRRLTQIMFVGKNGWDLMTLDDAQKAGVLDTESVSDVENQLMFFTLASWMIRGKQYLLLMEELRRFWGMRSTQLQPMDYLASLRTSTTQESSSVKEAV